MLHHGLRAAAGNSAAAPVTSVSFQAQASADGATVTWPAVQAGDLAVLFDDARNSGTSTIPTKVIPTGFTELDDQSDLPSTNGYRSTVSAKICDGTESGSLTGMNGNSHSKKRLLIFRGDNPITGWTLQSLNSQMTQSTPTSQSLTSASGIVPFVALARIYGYNIGSPYVSGFTGSSGLSQQYQEARYRTYDSSPGSHTISANDYGINTLTSFYLDLE